MLSKRDCLKCKGRLWCGEKCFILEKYKSTGKTVSGIKNNTVSGPSPPSVFVSWTHYPKVSFSPMAPPFFPDKAGELDAPEKWFGLETEKILSFRESLVGGSKRMESVSAANPSRLLSKAQEMLLSSKPVEVELKLKSMPSPRLSFDSTLSPVGPGAPLKEFSLTSSPGVDKKIDYLVSDTDAKANEAMNELFSSDYSVTTISKLLSAGLLGKKKKRRLTPTRWSITAADSSLADALAEKLKDYGKIDSAKLFFSSYQGNAFYVLFFPFPWAFEQLEAWVPGSVWAQKGKGLQVISDFEFFGGRKAYAADVAGAYYAAKLAVAEYLVKEKLQAACLVVRLIGRDYLLPLGVWVIRETVRDALRKKPMVFPDLSLALDFLKTHLGENAKTILKKSALLDRAFFQKSLLQFG